MSPTYSGDARLLSGPDGRIILADSEADARAFLDFDGGIGTTLTYAGWMGPASYPEDYDSRKEWEESPDFCDEWWEGCQPPVNDKQREHVRQAWRVDR